MVDLIRIRSGAGTRLIALALWAARAAGASPEILLQHHVRIEGAGPRTVLFEAGLGDTLDVWQTIQPRVADHCARTFSYTRAGYDGSGTPDGARDAVNVVRELRDELRRHNVDGPYVLVGHSLGGLYMQYFARNFPTEVAGVVLVDATHWKQGMTLDPGANTAYRTRTAVTVYMPLIMRHELSDSGTAGLQVSASPVVVDTPAIVLSSTRLSANETLAQRADAIALQDEIAAEFPGARHAYVENSGHYIQRDQPDVVVSAARELAGCDLAARIP